MRAPIFSLYGVILYELLAGATPYKADSVQATMFKRTRERPKPPIEVNPEIPQHSERHYRQVPRDRSEAALSIGAGNIAGFRCLARGCKTGPDNRISASAGNCALVESD